ncbi:hypothetical protein ACDQ55_19190 [Chitinophaga sp. 30R24]|uniref:hypothetical protein n=1 Tax=Chitinophaga sp. 30R24 TaxID=3248838 RepID=UPI003B8F8B89
MSLLLLGLFVLAIGLMFSLYRNHNRKKAVLWGPVRSANILKIHSYRSFGILATVRFKDEQVPHIGDRLHEGGNIYEITGVVDTDPALEHPNNTWDCRLVKI